MDTLPAPLLRSSSSSPRHQLLLDSSISPQQIVYNNNNNNNNSLSSRKPSLPCQPPPPAQGSAASNYQKALPPDLVRLPSTASSTYSLPDPTTFPIPQDYNRFGAGSAVSSSGGTSSSSARTTSRGSGSVRDSGASSSFGGDYAVYGNGATGGGGGAAAKHQRTNSFIVGGGGEDQLDEEEEEESEHQQQSSSPVHPRQQTPARPLREVHHRSYQQHPLPSSSNHHPYPGRHAPHPSYSSTPSSSPPSSNNPSRIGLGITSDTAIHLPPTPAPSGSNDVNGGGGGGGRRWSNAYATSSTSSVVSGYGEQQQHQQNGVERGYESESESDGESESSGYGWDGEGGGSIEGAAVALAENGDGKIVRGEGLDLQKPRLASELIGSTHLLLSSSPTPYLMPSFLETVLPSLLSTLVVLDVSSCNLSSLPEELSNLYVLEELNVSNNPLGSLPPSLSQLHTLRVLSANETGCSALPATFAALQNLHTLCLRRNRLLSLPGWLSLLPNMETLLVEDNPFAGPWKPLVEQMLVQWSPAGGEPMDQHASSVSGGGGGSGSTPNTDSFYLADASPSAQDPTFAIPPSPAASSTYGQEVSAGQHPSVYASFPSPVASSSSQQAPRSAPLLHFNHSHNSYSPSPTPTENRSAVLASRRPSLPQGMIGAGPGLSGRFARSPNLSSSDPPLAEAPSQATLRGPPPPTPAEPERVPVVRRMKSAGALFHLGLGGGSKESSRPGSPAEGLFSSKPSFASSGIGLGAPPARPPQKRFASMGREGGKSAAMSYRPTKGSDGIEELDGEEGGGGGGREGTRRPSTPSGELNGLGGPVKEKEKGKWGFLKKMSMGRMRSGSGTGSTIRPPPPLHSNTAPVLDRQQIPGLPTRPSTSMGSYGNGKSNACSNRNGNSSNSNGTPSTSSLVSSDATPPAMPSPGFLGASLSSHAALTSRKNKRRSYLPLDVPPSLTIPIPSTSPFMSSVSTFSSATSNHYLPSSVNVNEDSDEDEAEDDPAGDSASILESYLQHSPLDSPTMTYHPSSLPPPPPNHRLPSHEASEEFKRASYLAGLRKVMGYLRDLHDLSLPANAGLFSSNNPIDGPTGLDTPASQFSGSSPSPAMMTTPTPPLGSTSKSRTRRPTTGGGGGGPPEMKREFSEGSMMLAQSSPGGASFEGGVGMGRAMSTSTAATTENGSDESSERVEVRKYKEDRVKRAMVVREIVETERTYVKGLQQVVELYVKPSEAPFNGIGSKETVVPLAERKVVFNGLSGLLQFHLESFLPKLEAAARPLLSLNVDDQDGALSRAVAADVGDVFRTYNPFMRMYSTYINNFDNSLQRLKSWTVAPSPSSTPGSPTSSTAALATMGLALSAVSPPLTPDGSSSSSLTSTQRKRVKAFLKRARQNPKHTQLNLESYLLLPVQRIPRYRMLLEDLLKCTPPLSDQAYDPLEDAFEEISSLASCMNEEKRDSESRRRLVQWQSRIRGKFPSPLVQPHRKLLLDGSLTLTRIVKKMTDYVEVTLPIIDDGDNTIQASKSVVAIECLADPETLSTPLVAVLTSDLLVLCKTQPDPAGKVKTDANGLARDGTVDLFAVLRMQTKSQPASITNGSTIRVVDNRAILYFEAPSTSAALTWLNAINVSFQVSRS
ncbi:hypothetical protein BDY24DRAFT_411722 [Mrakia frigida]|uniref:uncharacterized protein n=1 Tax=Mrakia frigida TaxID=29902 RepID=UPI003FCC2395